MGGPSLDPEKVRQFNQGWQQMQKDNVHDSKIVAGTTATGIAVGAGLGSVIPGAGTAVGAFTGAVVGFMAGCAYTGYEKLTKQGYYSGR